MYYRGAAPEVNAGTQSQANRTNTLNKNFNSMGQIHFGAPDHYGYGATEKQMQKKQQEVKLSNLLHRHLEKQNKRPTDVLSQGALSSQAGRPA